jgi:agmatine deiminase
MESPKSKGYYFPAEWEKHEATWLTWPYKDDSFPGKLMNIYQPYSTFIKYIARKEKVRIIVPNIEEETKAKSILGKASVNTENIEYYLHPTNDVWCRDHGPAFVISHNCDVPKAIVNWDFNGWGNKYPSELDNQVPLFVAQQLGLPVFNAGIVMEGGSIDVNDKGTLITTESCLLQPTRNVHLSKDKIEDYLRNFYGVEQILWLGEGIVGDDTDGHVDDLCRFVNSDTVITVVETNRNDENYEPLQNNLKMLKTFRLPNSRQLNIIELPMPKAVYYRNDRLPASYANFYICNSGIMVPVFRCKNDEIALKIIEEALPGKTLYDIDCFDIICGLGALHCLSQQEPAI